MWCTATSPQSPAGILSQIRRAMNIYRNMVTGAFLATVAVILVDATHGVKTQTLRHSFLSSLLGIRHVVVAVNKMDLAGFRRIVFDQIVKDFLAFSEKFPLESVRFVLVCALNGDNIADRSRFMPWYAGPSLLDTWILSMSRRSATLSTSGSLCRWQNGPVARVAGTLDPWHPGFSGRVTRFLSSRQRKSPVSRRSSSGWRKILHVCPAGRVRISCR